jgi:hypothetical protein
MSLFSEMDDAFEAAEDPAAPSAKSATSPPPDPDIPRRFRGIERNQPSWRLVDLERMIDESHPARAI